MQINLSRIICRLDIKGEHLIKGINFEGLRKIGNPNEYAKKYSKYNICGPAGVQPTPKYIKSVGDFQLSEMAVADALECER